jgi:hypothetical protein
MTTEPRFPPIAETEHGNVVLYWPHGHFDGVDYEEKCERGFRFLREFLYCYYVMQELENFLKKFDKDFLETFDGRKR